MTPAPGPYVLRPDPVALRIQILDANGNSIGCVYLPLLDDLEKRTQAEATAELLARAPDLQAACEAMLDLSACDDVTVEQVVGKAVRPVREKTTKGGA